MRHVQVALHWLLVWEQEKALMVCKTFSDQNRIADLLNFANRSSGGIGSSSAKGQLSTRCGLLSAVI